MKAINAYWKANTLTAVVRADDGGAELVEHRAEHCFFVRASTPPELVREFRDSRHCVGIVDEGEFIRVRWRYERPDLSKPAHHVRLAQWLETTRHVDTFEADVSPVRRWIVENEVEIDRPRRCYVDLETDSRVPFSKKTQARILAWVVVGEGDGSDVRAGVLEEESDDAERELLRSLWAVFRGYDQIVAWNGDRFDFPMILARSERVGLHGEHRRWLWLDHLVLFRRMNMSAAESGDEKQSMALDAVARAVLGAGKLEGVTGAQSFDLWSSDRATLLNYCARDADLMRQIEARTGYVELLQTLCESTHTFPDSYGINPTVQVEGFLMRLARERGGLRFPSHFGIAETERFAGAWVMDPTVKGYARGVHVADFSGMYPSIITSWNMSIETHRPTIRIRERAEGRPVYLSHLPLKEYPLPPGHCVAAKTEVVFANEPRGILAEAVDELGRLRSTWNKRKAAATPGTDAWKEADRRSSAYKIARNSFYGVAGSPFSRFFVRELAESVSQCGAWLIEETIAAARARGFDVVYGDTDSIFVRGVDESAFREFVVWCNAELYPRILREKGCARCDVAIDYEKAFERIVFVTAKRYVGRYAHYKGTRATVDSKPEVKGLEWKRGDVARFARALQGEVIALMMAGDEPPSVDVFEPILDRWKARILEGELALADVVLSKRLAKPLVDYQRRVKKTGEFAGEPPHVAVARELRKRGLDVGEGVKIEYVVVDGEASPIKCAPACDWNGEVDRFYLWETLVYPPTERLLAAAYPATDWRRWERARPPKRARVPAEQGALPGVSKNLKGSRSSSKPEPGKGRLRSTAKAALQGSLFDSPRHDSVRKESDDETTKRVPDDTTDR